MTLITIVNSTVVSSAVKEVIVGFTLSVYTVEIVTISWCVPAASVTVNAAAEEEAFPNIGLLNALVNVYVLPLTLVWVAQ